MDQETTEQIPPVEDETKQASSAFKLLSIEIFVVGIISILILSILNYFNIVSTSKIFPKELDWLPERENPDKISSIPKPTPSITQETSMISYAKEVLRPEFIPKLAPASIDYYRDQRYFKMEHSRGGARVDILYFESLDGLPMDINVSIYNQGIPAIKKDNFLPFLEKYFIYAPETTPSDIESFTIDGGGSVLETVWDNPDGTKESRSILRFETWREIEEPVTFIQACRLFQENPLYSKNTCFDREL